MANGFTMPQLPRFTGRSGRALPHTPEVRDTYRRVIAASQTRIPEVDEDTRKQARLSAAAPRVPWDVFLNNHFDWQHGEHVTMIGPTGEGKTTAMLGMIKQHPYHVVFGTKPKDATLDGLVAEGYLKMDRWQSIDPTEYPRRLLWPNATDIDSKAHMRTVFKDAMQRIFREGSWTVAADELGFLTDRKFLGLSEEATMMLIQGRSLGISFVSATQRPAWVPLEVYGQATHLFLWKTTVEEDQRRLSFLNGSVDPNKIREVMNALERFQFLYVNVRTGEMLRTRAPEIKGT